MKIIWQRLRLRGSRFNPYGAIRSLLIAAVLVFAADSCFAQTAFVRVNQVGYPSTSTKRAYLMTSTTETGATFSVVNSSNQILYSSAIGARLGSWGTFTNVYALDF